MAARAHVILPGQSDSRARARHVRAPSGYDANVIEVPGFRILRQLGRGGMATVYLALQESVDREVALKVMSPALLVDPDFGERFLREAKIAARLHHRHVVGIHDVGRSGDYHYIAMEYLAGGAVLPKDGSARDVAFALRVVREIAGALAYAHEKGFVHRDVKPDNILLRDDGSAALTDFGIARALDNVARVTRTGAVVGTPHYMSPEQARGKQIDGRADLYSLGIVLYEMLVGRVPYHADDSLAIGIMHITQPVPELPQALQALQPLLDRLLAKQPEDRFQTGGEVAAAILAMDGKAQEGALPGFEGSTRITPSMPSGADTVVDAAPLQTPPRERAEPNLGRIEGIVAALDEGPRGRAEARDRAQRRAGQGHGRAALAWAFGALVVAALAWAAWNRQDDLRDLLPRTGFNDTLARAQQALDAGRLTSTQGDGARELFLAARAQDPDSDTARRGLDEVARRLLERARAAIAAGDPAAARNALDGARELSGGGAAVEELERSLKQLESRDEEVAQLLDQAQDALSAGRIVGADGAAALYQRVLEGESGNALASSGLVRSADALAAQADAALSAGNAATAQARADDIARILPTYTGLPELMGRLTRAREAEASALSGTLDRAEARLREGALAGGDDSALELFRAVLAKDPMQARAKAGLARIAQAWVVRANAAIDDGNDDAADALLRDAAALAPESPELRAARSQLRELRERQAIGSQHTPVTPQQSARVRELVAEAQQAANAGRLIVPPGDSAYDKYRAALAIDRDDVAAREGLERLPARAKALFAQALADAAVLRANTLLDAIRQIAPGDPDITPMGARLADAFLDQADLRIGEGRREDAVRALDAARALAPANPRIETLESRLRAWEQGMGNRE